MRILTGIALMVLFCSTATAQSDKSDALSCSVDVRWLNTSGSFNHPRSSELPVQLSFLVHLGKGSDCSTAEVSLTATYLTENQDFICSGTIRQAMSVTSAVQQFNISVRPLMQLDFVRWRNQPGIRGEQQGKRLMCMNVDGTSDVGDAERQKAGWLRLSLGVLPARFGVAITEAVIRLTP